MVPVRPAQGVQPLSITSYINQYRLKRKNPTLIVNSSDIGDQREKDISTIVQYAPTLIPYITSPFRFGDKLNGVRQSIALERGYPSFFFIRLEWEPTEIDEGNIPRPTIQYIEFKLFGQECPYLTKLTEDELYHICHKNCHKYCHFQDLWENENALVLSLADIGLITEKSGYPRRKRLELEIFVKWDGNPAITQKLVDEANADTENRMLTLRTICIYENQQFLGDIRRSEFLETYV